MGWNSARRDIAYSLDVAAAEESAAFVLEHLPKAPAYWHPHDTLRFALGEIKGPGPALEFGVATGTTLKIIAETVSSDRTVVGFDIFTGLPETWRTGFPAGEFAQEEVPDIPAAQLVIGLFEDMLPAGCQRLPHYVVFIEIRLPSPEPQLHRQMLVQGWLGRRARWATPEPSRVGR